MNIETGRWTKFGSTANADFYEVDAQMLAVVPHQNCYDNGGTAKASVDLQLEYLRARNRRAGVVVFMDPILVQDSEARRVYRELPDPMFQACFALVGGTPFGRAAGSIFLVLSPPRVPTKFFSTFDEAAAWASSQVQAK